MNDEIAVLVDDIKRWAGHDARILESLEQLVKVYEAEVAALVFEAKELDGMLVRATTRSEQQRIIDAQPKTFWAHRVPDWRGDDYNAGAPPEDRSQM